VAAATGEVVKTTCVAVPNVVGEKVLLVAEVSAPLDAVKV
jgi:hypothetical protein